MAVTSGFFNSVNGDRKYNADQMSEYFKGIVTQGVFQNLEGGLAVTAGTGLSVNVATGRAIVNWKWVQNDDVLTLTIPAASSTYGRIDAIVLNYNETYRRVTIIVKAGTASASPAAPSMTRSGGVYQMALAYVNVSANATSVTVTDKRSDSTVCGWAAVAQSMDGEIAAMLDSMKTGFDGVTYSSPAAMVQGEDQKLQDQIDDNYNKLTGISDPENNLCDMTKIEIGKDWSGGSNVARAVVYVAVSPSTTYTISAPKNDAIGALVVIQKATASGSSPSQGTTVILSGTESTLTATENTNYFCLQFNGYNNLVSSDFDNYDVYVINGTSVSFTAIDKVARATLNDHMERYGNEIDLSGIQIGKDYTGGTNSKRAVLYVPVDSDADYYISVPASVKLTYISAIEKANATGASPLLAITNFINGDDAVVHTTANTNYFCFQFNSPSDIIASDFVNYDFYMRKGNKALITMIDNVARNITGFNKYDTVMALAESESKGLSIVGGYELRNIVDDPKALNHSQNAHSNPYYDVNSTVKEYQTINKDRLVPYDGILNDLPQEEIDFTPSDNGFTRIIVGKDDSDRFFVSYVASNRVGAFGDPKYDALEVTTDFENFTTILRSDQLETGDGIRVSDMTNLKVLQVKQFANGNYFVAIKCHSISGNNDYTHFYKLSADFSTITHMSYVNFNGQTVSMIDEFNDDVYDWSVFVSGKKALAVTYGSRNPETDLGRVWYTEDNGDNWKQVFQTNQHLQDGQAPGVTITQAHTHGVMIDPYDGRLFVIVGEDNRNVFWSDKGYNTTDSDWNVISLATSPVYNFQTAIQVVNGYPFQDSLVFGSDNGGVGCIYRLNKLDDGGYSYPEAAHEFLPNEWDGVYYCSADLSRRDLSSPLLMCETHESARFTEANNELLNELHKARVVATYDGINFTEVWVDDTYGAHDAYIDGQLVSRNYSWCMRGMNAWLLNNGDVVIKYTGRDYYYFGGDPMFSVVGQANGSCKVRLIKNAEKYL